MAGEGAEGGAGQRGTGKTQNKGARRNDVDFNPARVIEHNREHGQFAMLAVTYWRVLGRSNSLLVRRSRRLGKRLKHEAFRKYVDISRAARRKSVKGREAVQHTSTSTAEFEAVAKRIDATGAMRSTVVSIVAFKCAQMKAASLLANSHRVFDESKRRAAAHADCKRRRQGRLEIGSCGEILRRASSLVSMNMDSI